MPSEKQTVTESEYAIMKVLWQSHDKMAVAEVARALKEQNWSDSTVSSFLQRLLKKGVVACDKKGKTNLYYPLLKQEQYNMQETEHFLARIYKGSVKSLVAALYENKKISNDDLADLRDMFDLK